MNPSTESDTPHTNWFRKMRWPAAVWLGLCFAVSMAIFVGGAYTGRWAVKNQIVSRMKYFVLRSIELPQQGKQPESTEWLPLATALVQLEYSVNYLPGFDGWGGGISSLGDGRLLYATRTGEFGTVSTDGIAHVLTFRVDMNLGALEHHPVYKHKNFNPRWFRVADVSLSLKGDGRYELLVSHHYFDAQRQCVEMRLSQAELVEVDGALDLAAPFVTVAVTNPCITFSSAGLDTPFEGHFSGGRIARLAPDQVLWSTGDHGWIGLDGYPAVSQEDASSLGKLLRVNLRDKTVATFAKGFRNPQGLTIDSSGRVWVTDHGPRGGDRLVLAQEGGNYGWPFATYGTDYGPRPWPFNAVQGRPAFGDQSMFVWVPSIATSAVFEASSEMFKLWQGDLLVLSLAGNSLHRLRLENDRVIYDEPIIFSGYRLRAVAQMPNGQFAMLADNGTVIVVRNADPFRQSPYLDARTQQRRRSDQMSAEERTAAISRRVTQDTTLASGLTLPRLNETEEQGRAVFMTQCSPCHAIDTPEPRIGPSLMNVVGRRVGATTFGYSAALSGRASEVWTAERIVQFAQAPSSVFTGSAMPAVPLTPIQHTHLKTFLARLSQN